MSRDTRRRIDWNDVKATLHAAEAAPTSTSTDDFKIQDLFRTRALHLAARKGCGPSAMETTPVLVVKAGEESYGVELRFVAQVFPATKITPVPRVSKAVGGIANLQGEVRSVLRLRRLVGLPESEEVTNGSILLLRRDDRRIGLEVEQIGEIRHVDLKNLIAIETEERGRHAAYLAGMTRDQVLLLRTDRLFESV